MAYHLDRNILILSEEEDISTNSVMEWINSFGYNVIRLNEKTKIKIIDIDFNNDEIHIEKDLSEKILISKNHIHSFWYRRGLFNLHIEKPLINESISEITNNILFVRRKETELLNKYIFSITSELFHIGNYITDHDINKLHNLNIAKKHGLTIPDSRIFTNKKSLGVFLNKHKKIILKPFTEGGIDYNTDFLYSKNGTTLLKKSSDIDKYPDIFPPSFCQAYIEKKIELRIFFLENQFFSSAIFSQSNPKTKIDFRNYDDENPNRIIPFNLPKSVSEKLIKMINSLKLTSGSIDMIYTKKNQFVFLEVNPVGQFQQVSYPCNYYIEKKIAKKLISK